jgi:hypothetical protein
VQPEFDFVIISFDCNFWAMAALDALTDSLARVGAGCAVWVVHNFKTTRQLDAFRANARQPARGITVNHVSAYDGVFEQVVNFAEHDRLDLHYVIARHGLVLNPALAGLEAEIRDKLFVFPRHDTEPRSLTAPMFACDVTAARPLLAGLPDVGWVGSIVRQERRLLQGGGERYYTDAEFERAITRPHFDDTLHNVIRHLLARDPGLVDRLAAVRWPELDHVWHGATHHLRRAQVALLRQWMDDRFRPEQFEADIGVSSQLDALLARVDDCGLGDEFRRRFLGASGRSGEKVNSGYSGEDRRTEPAPP